MILDALNRCNVFLGVEKHKIKPRLKKFVDALLGPYSRHHLSSTLFLTLFCDITKSYGGKFKT